MSPSWSNSPRWRTIRRPPPKESSLPSGRCEDSFLRRTLGYRIACRREPRRGIGRIVLQGRQAALGEQPHVRLGLVVRQVPPRELGDQVLDPGDLLQPAELLQAVVGRADD